MSKQSGEQSIRPRRLGVITLALPLEDAGAEVELRLRAAAVGGALQRGDVVGVHGHNGCGNSSAWHPRAALGQSK
jgi:hypothetical protein